MVLMIILEKWRWSSPLHIIHILWPKIVKISPRDLINEYFLTIKPIYVSYNQFFLSILVIKSYITRYDELSIAYGEVINIHDKQEDGWRLGESNGKVGIFPATYVEQIWIFPETNPEQTRPNPSSNKSYRRGVSSGPSLNLASEWSHLTIRKWVSPLGQIGN